MRQRLRPAYPPEELARIYPTPHDHTKWVDHMIRVSMTVLAAHTVSKDARSGADLSCGDGAILRALALDERHFGDFAPGHAYTGPVEETIHQIPDVDLYVCTETLEHLDDPDLVLKAVRAKTRALVLSTPVDAWDETNPEHYWAWSREDVEEMLSDAGFSVAVYVALDLRPSKGHYCFGIWTAL